MTSFIRGNETVRVGPVVHEMRGRRMYQAQRVVGEKLMPKPYTLKQVRALTLKIYKFCGN